jgi:Lrp/AsnC family transcriptional regulator for asnA, asnC and gidA
MIDYLKSQKDIWWFVTVDGDWDIDFVILVKDIFDYYSIWENFINRYRKFIHRSETVIYSHIQGFPRSYLIGQENESEGFLISSKRDEITIDELDLKILRLIVNDCRINLVKLAEATNTDVRTIKNRIKQLENKKIIVGYRIALDLSKLGYQYYKVLFYLNNIKNIDKMKTFALMHPNIVFINKTIGGADFELEFHVTNIEEFYKVLNEFKRLFHKDIDYWYYFRVMEEYKMIYYPV